MPSHGDHGQGVEVVGHFPQEGRYLTGERWVSDTPSKELLRCEREPSKPRLVSGGELLILLKNGFEYAKGLGDGGGTLGDHAVSIRRILGPHGEEVMHVDEEVIPAPTCFSEELKPGPLDDVIEGLFSAAGLDVQVDARKPKSVF